MVTSAANRVGSSLGVWSRYCRTHYAGQRDRWTGGSETENDAQPSETDAGQAEAVLESVPVDRLDRLAGRTEMPAWMAAEDTSGI